MKKLFLLLILLFCCGCVSTQYKIYENCYTEQQALHISKSYLVIEKQLDINDVEKNYNYTIKDCGYTYFVSCLYNFSSNGNGYSIRCAGFFGYGMVIRKNNGEVISCWREY